MRKPLKRSLSGPLCVVVVCVVKLSCVSSHCNESCRGYHVGVCGGWRSVDRRAAPVCVELRATVRERRAARHRIVVRGLIGGSLKFVPIDQSEDGLELTHEEVPPHRLLPPTPAAATSGARLPDFVPFRGAGAPPANAGLVLEVALPPFEQQGILELILLL